MNYWMVLGAGVAWVSCLLVVANLVRRIWQGRLEGFWSSVSMIYLAGWCYSIGVFCTVGATK